MDLFICIPGKIERGFAEVGFAAVFDIPHPVDFVVGPDAVVAFFTP